jgi:hypothetical protein
MMSPHGTFDYEVEVPRDGHAALPWSARTRNLSGDGPRGTCLVGHSPTLSIADAGPDPNPSEASLADVPRCKLTLAAPQNVDARVSRASFMVSRDLVAHLRPGDSLHMVRNTGAGLAVSILRDGQLVVAAGAVTAVPLPADVEVSTPWKRVEAAEAIFREIDPAFALRDLPVEVRVREKRRVLFRGRLEIGPYNLFVAHGRFTGVVGGGLGAPECVGISRKDACEEATARSTALLLDSREVELFDWSGERVPSPRRPP